MLPHTAVVALMANIAVETGNTFDYKIKQRGARKPAHGLLQLDPKGKLPDYMLYLTANGYKDSAETQIRYFMDTIYGSNKAEIGHGVASKLRAIIASGSHIQITVALSDMWFKPSKPHLIRRLTQATIRHSSINQSAAETKRLRSFI